MSESDNPSRARFWVDGQPATGVPLSDRGFQYGDGVFETIRVVNGEMPLGQWHWSRLVSSCRRLKLPLDQGRVASQVQAFICERGSGTLKLTVTRGSGGRGYNPAGADGRVVLGWFPEVPFPDERSEHGVVVRLCDTRLGHSPVLAGLKHMNRLEQVLARGEWVGAEYGEGLVFDIANRLIEGTMSNVFLVESGAIFTPDLSLCGVDGVLRQWLLECCHAIAPINVCDLNKERLLEADEVFLGNSVMGVVPVVRCDSTTWSPGLITRRIQQEVFQLFHVNG